MNNSFTFVLPIDDVVAQVLLKKIGRPTTASKREEVANYVRDLFDRLDGTIASLAVGQEEVKVVWSQGSGNRSPIETFIEMLNQGQLVEASLLQELFLTGDPENESILYNLGMAYSDLGVLDRAIKYLKKLSVLYPKNVNGRVALGVAYMRHGEVEAARTELSQAVKLDPANPWALRNLGGCLAELGRHQEAVIHLRKSAELNPTDGRAWYGLGQVLEALENYQDANAAYRKVIDLDEYSDVAEMARERMNQIAANGFRAATPGMERMDAVMYCLGAIEKFEKMDVERTRQVGFEIAILGTKGLDINDPTPKYKLRSLPGQFSGLHLLCLQYVAFKIFAPDMNIGFDLSKEYRSALSLNNRNKSGS